MEAQESQDGMQENAVESLGMPTESHEGESQHAEGHGDQDDLPKGVKERLGRQERKHQREMREMKAALESMHSQLNSQPNMDQSQNNANPYDSSQGGGIDDQIHKAVSYALQHKENEERKAKEASNQSYINKQHQDLKKHLDQTADKYEDFEDVTGGDAPFTNHMVSAALMLPKKGAGSAGEVIYKLGKNPVELDRISKLHPLDQASEMIKLSHALMGGEEQKSSSPRPLGQIKNSPVNSHSITDKTSVSELRQRMKSNWK